MAEKRNLPIAFFDSGVGGVSVLREAVKKMPSENFIFFGDSANAPYGTKSEEEIRSLTLEHAGMLYKKGIKALVIACNTATSAAIVPLREIYTDIPVIGIEPAVKPAALLKEHPSVIAMATPLTVRGGKFRELLGHYSDKADIEALPCPGLMEFVEAGELDSPRLRAYLKDLLSERLERKPDAIVLGCTHYPFIKKLIREICGEDVQIMDGSEGTARELENRLRRADLLTDRKEKGKIEFLESLPEQIRLCEKLMQLP